MYTIFFTHIYNFLTTENKYLYNNNILTLNLKEYLKNMDKIKLKKYIDQFISNQKRFLDMNKTMSLIKILYPYMNYELLNKLREHYKADDNYQNINKMCEQKIQDVKFIIDKVILDNRNEINLSELILSYVY